MITVVGLGFVGLTTALGFSEKGGGAKVYGYDTKTSLKDSLRDNKVPFFEPGLEEMLKKHNNNSFLLVDSLEIAVNNSEVIFICVGTPADENGKADLTALKSALTAVLTSINDRTQVPAKTLVIKSTVPPTTTMRDILPFIAAKGWKVGHDIQVANNPEFLREGFSWIDFIRPDRIVVGVASAAGRDTLEKVYRPFDAPIHFVNYNTAEYIKYLSNTLLASMISFSNEQSLIAYSIGDIEIARAFKILHEDKRWSGNPANMTSYAYPGCGFGGYCLPKDTQALIAKAQEFGYEPALLKSVLQINNEIKEHLTDMVARHVPPGAQVAILGLAFKPNSDDVRQTAASQFIQLLLSKSVNNLVAFDPMAITPFKREYDLPIQYASNLEAACVGASAIVVLTAWPEFRVVRERWPEKRIYDFRYFLSDAVS